MGEITAINSAFTIRTSNTNFDCSAFDKKRQDALIKGAYSCQGKTTVSTGNQANATTLGNPNASSNPEDPAIPDTKTGLSGGAIGGIVVGALAVIFIIGIIFFFRRRKSKKNMSKGENNSEGTGAIGTDGKAEMDNGEVKRNEMPIGGHEIHEVEGQHGVSEIVAGDKERRGRGEADLTYELAGSEPTVMPKKKEIKRKPVL